MRDKDETDSDAQKERRRIGSPLFHPSEVLAPLSLFVSVYLATFVAAGLVLVAYVQLAGLIAVVVASGVTIRVCDRGRWDLGLRTSPANAVQELLLGMLLAAILIGLCSVLIILSTDLRHTVRGGFAAGELLTLFAPAVLHEELVFRGYAYQKLRRWSRPFAIAFSSSVFALLHTRNAGVSPVGILNIVIAGVLLALAYERFRRLWFPIGIHFAWNVMSGPVLGYPVSGYVPMQSLLGVAGSGPPLVTGGPFGIEGSVWMTALTVTGALLLAKRPKAE
jgi:membrane protease YdiL (CAAX protease family)